MTIKKETSISPRRSISYAKALGRWRRAFSRPSVDRDGKLLHDRPPSTVTVTYTFEEDKINYHLDSEDGVHRNYDIRKKSYDPEKSIFYGIITEKDGTEHGWAAIHFKEVVADRSITLCKCGTSGGAPTKEGVPETWSAYTKEAIKERIPKKFYTYEKVR